MTTGNISKTLIAAVAALFFAAIGFADTLELKDGRVLQGRYLGGTAAVLRFEVNGDVQTFPAHDIVALTFTRGGRRGVEPPPPDNPAPNNPPNDQIAAPSGRVQGYNGGD